MSCQAQTTTRWVESTSVYASTQDKTYTTTSTVTPRPVETFVVQSWCTTPDATFTEVPSTSTPAASTSVSESISETIDAGAGRLALPTQSLSSVSVAPSPTLVPPPESSADVLRRALLGERDPPSDCAWTTTTHWTMIYPDPTQSVFEVTATNTVWNTVQTSVPSVTVQECAETVTATATQDFWTESSGWILASSDAVLLCTEFPKARADRIIPSRPIAKAHQQPPLRQLPPIRSTTTGMPSASPVKLHDTLVIASVQPVASLGHINQQAVSTGSANSFTAHNEAVTLNGPSSAAKAGWACGTIGIFILLGLFAWFCFRRRKRQEERARYNDHSNVNEKGSFLDDFSDEDGGSGPYEGNTFKQVLLDHNEESDEDEVRQTKVSYRLVAQSKAIALTPNRTSPGLPRIPLQRDVRKVDCPQSLRSIWPSRQSFGPPTFVLRSNRAFEACRTRYEPFGRAMDTIPAAHLNTFSPDLGFGLTKTCMAVSIMILSLRQGEKQNRDSSGKSPYHYRMRSYVETPIQSPLGTPFATMAGFGLADRFDTDQRPTDLSPQTQKLLIDAIARPISVVTDRPGLPSRLTPDVLYQLPRHVLSVNSVYLEPETETVDGGRRHTYHSGWYRRSILKGLFPESK
ncbi:hypothetical protein QFC20_001694 [Naganishia adeliensis]|uniref:Uncharacterized protein n=1 Tax=Naganishia adeliensis TaxID=92952 RepID=A0ACC2WRR1_9TREE|nr:hypothetical protein QFC20_001694 [Naganishia adeliensis]